MSKVGKKPIEIPKGVKVHVAGQTVRVRGPQGELQSFLSPRIKVAVTADQIKVEPADNSRPARQMWGLTRTLLGNMIVGVTQGFKKELELSGIGLRAEKKGGGLSIALGFSQPIEFEAPEGITLNVSDKTKIEVRGMNKQLVGQVAAKIRNLRPPEPYKGKGVRYAGEEIRKKPGKAGKVGAAFGAPTSK